MKGNGIDCICGQYYLMTGDGKLHKCPQCGHVWNVEPEVNGIRVVIHPKQLAAAPVGRRCERYRDYRTSTSAWAREQDRIEGIVTEGTDDV